MSQQAGVLDITFKAGADLRTYQYRFVYLSASQTVGLCTTATGVILGVLQNEPNENEAAVVRVLGTSKVVCTTPAGVTFNNRVTSDSAGRATATTTNAHTVAGIMLEGPSTLENDIQEMLIAIHMVTT